MYDHSPIYLPRVECYCVFVCVSLIIGATFCLFILYYCCAYESYAHLTQCVIIILLYSSSYTRVYKRTVIFVVNKKHVSVVPAPRLLNRLPVRSQGKYKNLFGGRVRVKVAHNIKYVYSHRWLNNNSNNNNGRLGRGDARSENKKKNNNNNKSKKKRFVYV